MQEERQIRMQDGAQGQNGKAEPNVAKKRHGGRIVLSLDVEEHVRDALRDKAAGVGVSMAQYLSNAIARSEPPYVTSAVRIAQPLTQISYIVARAQASLQVGDATAALDDLHAANNLIAAALQPLQRQHGSEYRSNERRRAGGVVRLT